MKSFFSEAESPKINAIVKSVIFWLLFTIFLIFRKVISKYVFGYAYENYNYNFLVPILVICALAIMVKIERKTFAEYGLIWQKDTLFKLLKGLGIGLIIYAITVLTIALFTESTVVFNQNKWNPLLIFSYLMILPLAFMEEVAFRSYPFIKLNKVFGLRSTQIIIAISFSCYQMTQGFSILAALIGPGIFAYFFGLSAAWSKGISEPTGIHSGINLGFYLVGLNAKETNQLVFLKLPDNASPSAIAHLSQVGTITQLTLLFVAILLTEYYIRKKNLSQI